jgi:hypothetical protein
MSGKIGIFRGKVLKNRFPKKFQGKIRGKTLSTEKMYKKSAPDKRPPHVKHRSIVRPIYTNDENPVSLHTSRDSEQTNEKQS